MRGHAFPLSASLHVGVRKALHFIEGLVLLRALGAPDTGGYCSISVDTDLERKRPRVSGLGGYGALPRNEIFTKAVVIRVSAFQVDGMCHQLLFRAPQRGD